MVATNEPWPNESGFDTSYEEHEPVELAVKGTIPHYAAGVLCKCSRIINISFSAF
jgi:torulene dioxygenase